MFLTDTFVLRVILQDTIVQFFVIFIKLSVIVSEQQNLYHNTLMYYYVPGAEASRRRVTRIGFTYRYLLKTILVHIIAWW